MRWHFPEGQTPLDPQETAGLKVQGLNFQHELNALEAGNIAGAAIWAWGNLNPKPFDLEYLQRLHFKMFGEVWGWAGKLRNTNKNLGPDWTEVRVRLVDLLLNAKEQASSSMTREHVVAFYHHGLVAIHPFPNGNGRWARLAAELLCERLSIAPPTWIELTKDDVEPYRRKYLEALRLADAGDLSPLERLMFTR